MVCESMTEDRSEGSVSNNVKSDQFTSADDYAPKVRKPYTITKQRERWTEEEHKKFLEALKLYGRAWRRIEEHVGTKTAVQIRSHAQKFFSKVVRESTSGDVSEVKPIEIPPPRPKRKPMHPYPRKLSNPIKTGTRSISPNSSGSDQENQSPTSVLSAGGSNIFAGGDSCSPNVGSSENDLSPEEENKPESCGEEKGFANESSPSTQSLKLFGKTVVITESQRPSSINEGEGNVVNMVPVSSLPCGAPVYYMQFLDENCDSKQSTSATPWWSVYNGVSYPFVQPCDNNNNNNNNRLEAQNVGEGEGENMSDTESGGAREEEEEKQKKPFLLVASERSAFTKQHSYCEKKEKCIKGFVPYKRCLAQRESHSSGEEREEQRIRLCL